MNKRIPENKFIIGAYILQPYAQTEEHIKELSECGVRLVVKWLFPKGRHNNGEYRTTKPDTDNLQKLLKDCMTKCGFWKDDALVASEIVEKFWADVPGIYIQIEELNSNE